MYYKYLAFETLSFYKGIQIYIFYFINDSKIKLFIYSIVTRLRL